MTKRHPRRDRVGNENLMLQSADTDNRIRRIRESLSSRVLANEARSSTGVVRAGSIEEAVAAIERLVDGATAGSLEVKVDDLRRLSTYFLSRGRALSLHADAIKSCRRS